MNKWGLRIARFSVDGLTLHYDYGTEFAELMIRCALPGWQQKAWFVVRARTPQAAQRQHRKIHGHRIIIYDAAGPVWSGWIMAVQVDGRWLRIECNGTYAARMTDAWYTEEINVAWNVSEFFQSVLNEVAPAVYVAAANFDANATEIGDMFLGATTEGPGIAAADVVAPLLGLRDPSYRLFDFYLSPRRWLRGRPQNDAAYYRIRETSRDSADWYYTDEHLIASDRPQHSHIYGYQNKATVLYGRLLGTCTVPDPPDYYLHDTTVDFNALGVRPGDKATDLTRSAGGAPVYMYIAAVSEDGHTLTGGSGYNWYDEEIGGHEYSITMLTPAPVTVTGPASPLWDSVGVPFEAPLLNVTQATQMATELAAALANPVYQEPFTLGRAPRHGITGAPIPLWSLLRRPSYGANTSRMGYTEDSLAAVDLLQRRGIYTTALDYSHDDLTLTVTPNELSDRFDVLLQQAGLVRGQTIESSRDDGGIDPTVAAIIESFRRRGGGRAPVIVWDWRRYGAPPADWEERMRAQGLNPQILEDPRGTYRNDPYGWKGNK